jgi:hypothetical protein
MNLEGHQPITDRSSRQIFFFGLIKNLKPWYGSSEVIERTMFDDKHEKWHFYQKESNLDMQRNFESHY